MRTLKHLTFAVAVLAACGACNADTVIPADEYSNLIEPDNSPVRFASYNTDNLSVSFDGAFILTGKYELGYQVFHTPGEKDTGVYGFTFWPDAEIVARLPRWEGFPKGPKTIAFDNFGDFLSAVVPKPDLRRLQRGKTASYEGRVSVRVDHYWTAKPCGYPEFAVHFLEVVKPPALVASGKTIEPRNC